jgi:hypothetical protein
MGDSFIRNIDLMRPATLRRPVGATVPGRLSLTLWEDIPLPAGVRTRLKPNGQPRCIAATFQLSWILSSGFLSSGVIPICTIRDGSVQANVNTVSGLELFPGDTLSVSISEYELNQGIFIDVTTYSAVLYSTFAGTLKCSYGVLQ